MNCQEFRSKWNHSADDAVFTHIETCDDCLNWIEKSANTVEEAMFLKEYPTPSVELEERIMQAIYATASHNVPLTATALPASGDLLSEKPNKRRFFIPTWVAAAGILIAVGLIGGPMLTGSHSDQFSENAAAPAAAPEQQTTPANETTGGTNSAKTGAAAPQTTIQAAPGTEPASDQQNATLQAPSVAKQADAQVTPFQATAPAPAASASQTAGRVTMANRSKHELKAQPPALPNRSDVPASEAPAEQPATHTPEQSMKTAAPEPDADSQNLMSAFAENPETDQQRSATDQVQTTLPEGASGKMALTAENPITISTFSDVDTAVQASDLPVPTLSKPPSDYTLGTLTVQYESQTSKHVSSLRTSYQQTNTGKQITVDVTPNPQGKRSLSVPGEFSNTQVFQIDGEQAIGVTYKETADAASVKSAVHYQTTKGNQSVYVVVSADGIPLSELIEISKQLNWKTK